MHYKIIIKGETYAKNYDFLCKSVVVMFANYVMCESLKYQIFNISYTGKKFPEISDFCFINKKLFYYEIQF